MPKPTAPSAEPNIHDERPGWRINAGKDVADAVIRQTSYGAQCYNADVRRDQRYLAEHRLLPCAGPGEERFSMTLAQDLAVMDLTAEFYLQTIQVVFKEHQLPRGVWVCRQPA